MYAVVMLWNNEKRNYAMIHTWICFVFSYYYGHLPDIWTLRKEIDKELPLTYVVDFW